MLKQSTARCLRKNAFKERNLTESLLLKLSDIHSPKKHTLKEKILVEFNFANAGGPN